MVRVSEAPRLSASNPHLLIGWQTHAVNWRRASDRAEDARALLRLIYNAEMDLFPDAQNKTLTVRLHHLTQAAHDEAVLHLCDVLNATETLFPGTDLRLIYKVGSC